MLYSFPQLKSKTQQQNLGKMTYYLQSKSPTHSLSLLLAGLSFAEFLHILQSNATPLFKYTTTNTTIVLRLFFWDHPGEPVPEENFWTYGTRGD